MEPSLGLLGGGGGGGGTGLPSEQEEKGSFMAVEEAELELGLGLTLGNSGGSRRRILTAKDFPNGFSSGGGGVAGAGTKRERPAGGGGGGGDGVDEGCSSAAVSQVVGWPPIRAYRMNTLFTTQSKASNGEDEKGVGGNENNEKKSKKKINHGNEKSGDAANERSSGRLGLVKVNMDGLPIGRKVDLNAHKSYETLAKTLEEMFFKPSVSIRERPMLLDGSSEFVLTYEDKEGDWMLVGDVPWRMFLNTVKRLRIMRTAEANGLAPKFQERDEKQKGKPI